MTRAFAAELLAPSAALRARVRDDVVSPEDVDALALELDVSRLVIRHQLENHRIASVAEG
jgi:Zn-dependent peptidase ImmA (M78 family)